MPSDLALHVVGHVIPGFCALWGGLPASASSRGLDGRLCAPEHGPCQACFCILGLSGLPWAGPECSAAGDRLPKADPPGPVQ